MLASSARSAKILGRTTTADIEPLVEVMTFDWSETDVGSFQQWPEALKGAARTAMISLSPMAVMIGPSGLLISNTAADPLFGDRTGKLGRPARSARPGAASVFDELVANYLAGKPSCLRNEPFKLERNGQFETAWFNIDVVPILDASGTPLGGLMMSFETTEHVREMRTLAQSEERFRLALEASGMVGVWDLDLAKNINTADPAVDSVFGIPPEVAHSGPSLENYIAAIHADDRGRVENAVRESIATGQPYRARYRVAGSDGKERWVIASGKPVQDESARSVRFPGVIIDITEQMQTAAALNESRFQFETLIEALPQIVWSCDAKGEHDYFSARWYDYTGLPQGSIHPETWKKLVCPEDRQRVFACLDAAIRTGQPYDIEYRFLHNSGEYRWLRAMALPVRNETGRITRWFGTSTDIHDARLLASEREKVSKELERLATLDPLTGVLARRAFFERAETHLAKLTRDRTSCVLMLDLDHFKQINDTYGHAGGDKALSIFAKRVSNCLRGNDLFGRLGGEEFAILLASCSEKRGTQVAERIRTRLERESIDLGNGTRTTLTVSIGIAIADRPPLSLEGLLAEADQALYRVKNSGRNACHVWNRDEAQNPA